MPARTLKTVLEERDQAFKAAQALNEKAATEKRQLTEEEAKEFRKQRDAYVTLGDEADRLEFLERGEGERTRQRGAGNPPPAPTPRPGGEDVRPGGDTRTTRGTAEQRAIAMQAWFRHQVGADLTEEHRTACEATGLRPDRRELVIELHDQDRFGRMQRAYRDGPLAGAESRALSAVTVADGGAITSPESMVNALEVNLLAFGGVLQSSEIMRTAGRERLRWPTVNDTSNKGRRIGESAAVTSTAQPTFAKLFWDAYKYTSDEILVPFELLAGTPFDLPGVLGRMLGERIGRKLADDFTTGTGAEQPRGIVTAATTFSAAGATSIAWDDLEGLESSVDPAYRVGAAYMMHDTIRKQLRLLKDGVGRPLWADGPNAGQPATLRGYPFFINQSMASAAASGAKTILFGQLSRYKVREVGAIRIYRLQERFRENDQDAFLAFLEADGNLVDAGTAPVKVLTH